MYVARCWNAIRDTRQSRPVLPCWTLLVNWAVCNDLPLSSSTRQSYLFATDSGRGLLQLVDILNTLFNILSGQLTFITETFELLTKAMRSWLVICEYRYATARSREKIKVLNLNCCCTISVVLMKCVGYVVWTLTTYNDSLAQIRNTTAEIRNFFLKGGCFYWRTRRHRQLSQHKPGPTYSNVVDAAIDATNLVCHHATPPSPSQLETFPFPQIIPTTDFPAHYWLTEHVDFGFISVFRSHFFSFFWFRALD